MTEPILRLLTRLSEAGTDSILSGGLAAFYRGPILDRMLSRRVLIEQAPLTQWEVCDHCECGLAARRISAHANGFRAECPLHRRHDVNLTQEDVLIYRVEPSGLASVIGAAAGFGGTPSIMVHGIWQLGALPSGRIVLLALEAAAVTGRAVVATIRQAAQGQDVTLLVPSIPLAAAMGLRDAGFYLVETCSAMVPVAGGFGVTIDPVSLSPASATASLQVRTAAAEVEWLGRSVILSHQLFPVFRRLLEKAKSRDQVASGPEVEGTTGREAKDLIRELRAAFVAAGLAKADAASLIVTVRGRGYRLGVPASEILVDG